VLTIFWNCLKNSIKVDTTSYKTVSVNKATAKKEWVVVDATGMSLGRFSSRVAMMLRGKHKPSFTPHVDCGDNVIVINAEKIVLTGNKWTDRFRFRHSGYPGGQTAVTPKEVFDRDPSALIEASIKGMLPRTRLGREQFRNLYVYTGTEHKHQGQNPVQFDINKIK
jgi:large subunit ribosomal protein L13